MTKCIAENVKRFKAIIHSDRHSDAEKARAIKSFGLILWRASPNLGKAFWRKFKSAIMADMPYRARAKALHQLKQEFVQSVSITHHLGQALAKGEEPWKEADWGKFFHNYSESLLIAKQMHSLKQSGWVPNRKIALSKTTRKRKK